MEKLLIISLVTITTLLSPKPQNKYTIELLTSGKWFIEYIIVEGQKLEFAPEIQERTWMLFHPKGKAEFMVEGRKGIGRWEFDKTSNILTTIKGVEIKEHQVISIDYEKLVLQELGEEESIIGLRK